MFLKEFDITEIVLKTLCDESINKELNDLTDGCNNEQLQQMLNELETEDLK